ncbi:MAG: hypothetical protein WCO06_02730 [Candidatus Roizmanbacteria bacterium]
MEQHPIPRQITSFEFKLIGFMTLKQFLYLLAFIPAGLVVIKIFPIPLINILLGVLVIGFGAALAFLPINERPLDVYVRNLYKRLMSPTQYFYLKNNQPLYFLQDLFFLGDPHRMLVHIESQEKLANYLNSTRGKKPVSTTTNQQKIQTILNTNQKGAVGVQVKPRVVAQGVRQPVPVRPISSMRPLQRPQSTQGPVVQLPPRPPLQKPVQPVVQQPSQQSVQSISSPPPISTRPQFIQEVVSKVEPVQQRVPPSIHPSDTPVFQNSVPTSTQQVNQLPQAVGSAPSDMKHPFLTGIIKNNRKIPLPGVLVYIKNNLNQPIRLLKTNPYGIFATYHPLSPGEYAFEVKDPKGGYFFDTIKVQVAEVNSMPIELCSKELL